jgi:hypothetical protein
MARLPWLTLLLIAWLTACTAGGGSLGPDRPSPTPPGPIVNQPALVSFPELNGDPARYRDKLIRVTGAYTQLPLPECGVYSGPRLKWALIAGNLRLDGQGLEVILRLVPEGMELTIDGVWHYYEGPLGCGKGAVEGSAWYLEALQIIQPNPLPGGLTMPGGGVLPATATPDGAAATREPEPGATSQPIPTQGTAVGLTPPVATIGATTTGVATGTATGTATVAGLTTPSPGATGTATPTGTILAPTGTATPSPTATGSVTPGSGLPTATQAPSTTPGGYPAPPTVTVAPPYP